MPHRKKKAFIEKKKAVTFHLVHRSQRDPLAADEKAPQHVLLPAAKVELEKRREEQRNFGVFFDDDYDYLQHLKEASGQTELVAVGPSHANRRPFHLRDEDEEDEQEEEGDTSKALPAASINLPSSVFASEFEEEVGLLNKAAPISGPRLDMDPDIVAALDEDFDYDDPSNILEDDFIIKANSAGGAGGAEGDEDDDDEWEDTDDEGDFDSEGGFSDDEDVEEGGRGREFLFMDEETKSRFTEYSLSSSVMRRNEQLTLLDDRFEKFYEQFDDDEIGALDNAELEGFIEPDSARLEEIIKDYFVQKEKESLRPDDLGPKELPVVKEEEEDEEEEEEMETVVMAAPEEKWDCETIVSTYSNIYNRPKVIEDPPKSKPIRVSTKTGIPLDVLPARGLTTRQAERMTRINDSDLPRVATQPRDKQESKEERRARKQAIKEERKGYNWNGLDLGEDRKSELVVYVVLPVVSVLLLALLVGLIYRRCSRSKLSLADIITLDLQDTESSAEFLSSLTRNAERHTSTSSDGSDGVFVMVYLPPPYEETLTKITRAASLSSSKDVESIKIEDLEAKLCPELKSSGRFV